VSIGNSVSWTMGVKIWTAPVATGASMTLTLDAAARVSFHYSLVVVAYTGYDTGDPIGAIGTFLDEATPDGAQSLTLDAAPATTSEVLAMVGMDKESVGVTPGGGWSELYDVHAGSSGGAQVQIRTGSTSTSVDWVDVHTGTGGIFKALGAAIEIKAAEFPVLASSTFLAFGASSTSAAVPIPSGVVAGSTCVVHIVFEHADASPPTGLAPPASGGTWTHVSTNAGDQIDGNSTRNVVYEYRAAGSESGTWTFTWTNACQTTATAHRITGAATSGSIFDSPVDHEFAGSDSTSSPAVQLTTPGDERLLLWLTSGYFGAPTWTPPTGFTEISDDPNITAAWKEQAVAGDTGALTGSNADSDRKVAFLGSIGPASDAPPTGPFVMLRPVVVA
jgi:hypothetical protein